jgi:RNA polymerase sigma-70 factor (ECF subfamily)
MPLFRNDPDLLRAFKEGRRAALERVYRTYVGSVDRYVHGRALAAGYPEMAQPSAVADILQEVFIRAFSVGARAAYDGLRDFGPYLTTIAHNCFVDVLRARGREVLVGPEELSLVVDVSPSDDGELADPRVSELLAAYLGGLSAGLASVYEQRFVLGRSQMDAAAALGLSRRKLRTAEGRLRRGLRKALSRAGISLRDLEQASAEFATRIPARAVSGGRRP